MLDAGTHVYYRPHEDLPDGLAPFAAMVFNDAVTNGYYLP
jgi:hypothetical protein